MLSESWLLGGAGAATTPADTTITIIDTTTITAVAAVASPSLQHSPIGLGGVHTRSYTITNFSPMSFLLFHNTPEARKFGVLIQSRLATSSFPRLHSFSLARGRVAVITSDSPPAGVTLGLAGYGIRCLALGRRTSTAHYSQATTEPAEPPQQAPTRIRSQACCAKRAQPQRLRPSVPHC